MKTMNPDEYRVDTVYNLEGGDRAFATSAYFSPRLPLSRPVILAIILGQSC